MSTFLDPYVYEAAAMHQAELREAAPLAVEPRAHDGWPWTPAARPCLFRLLWASR